MSGRDEWFAVYASAPAESAPAEKSLTKPGSPRSPAGGFRVDPETAPALRAAFQEAIEEMSLAREAMREMRYMRGTSVNPVVDKYLAALAETGYGTEGSVTIAAESAITTYQSVIDQLDRIMAAYRDSDEQAQGHHKRLRS